jgi:hypothetical protein
LQIHCAMSGFYRQMRAAELRKFLDRGRRGGGCCGLR